MEVLIIKPPHPSMDLWSKYSTFQQLLTTTTWCRRFLQNCRNIDVNKQSCLTGLELKASRTLLLHWSQRLSYPVELEQVMNGKPISRSSPLLSLCHLLGEDRLMRVGGRINHSEQSYHLNHSIILHKHSLITRLLALQVHTDATHAGPHTMLSILARTSTSLGSSLSYGKSARIV